jgi:hypothetical protein
VATTERRARGDRSLHLRFPATCPWDDGGPSRLSTNVRVGLTLVIENSEPNFRNG